MAEKRKYLFSLYVAFSALPPVGDDFFRFRRFGVQTLSTIETTFPLSSRGLRTDDSQISWMLKYTIEDPEILSLAAGLVDQPTLPNDLLRDAFEKVFSSESSAKSSLQYGATAGLLELRQLLAKRLEKQGLSNVDPECIVISNGGQQSLFTMTEVMVDPGDIVLVEDPTYFVYMDVLKSAGAKTIGLATDDEGIIPEALEARFEELHKNGLRDKLKVLYVMSYYTNPKGSNMSEERRRKIYDIYRKEVERGGMFLLMEDASYRDLWLEGKDEPFLKTWDPDNEYVFVSGTFSKALAPGLRLGWSYMPKPLHTALCRQKGNQDFGTSNLTQRILFEIMKSGAYDTAAERFRDRYLKKRDTLLAAIGEFLPADTQILRPKGGLYVWVQHPEINTDAKSPFFNEMLKEKVIYVPGQYCYCGEPQQPRPNNAMRTCYGLIGMEEMKEAIRRMGAVIERMRGK